MFVSALVAHELKNMVQITNTPDRVSFRDMQIGDQFTIIDDGEFYITAYKVDDENYIDSQHGFRQPPYDAGRIYEVTGRVQIHAQVTEVERVALTQLSKTLKNYSLHPILAKWIEALLADPGMLSNIHDWWFDLDDQAKAPLVTRCNELGAPIETDEERGSMKYDFNKTLYAKIMDYKAIPNDEDRDVDPRLSSFRNQVNRVVIELAYAVREYRERGRVAGDTASTLSLGVGAGVTITTSLAAAIVEFNETILNIAINRANYLGRRRERKHEPDYYLNLTQHDASPEQIKAGVVDLDDESKKNLRDLLTFDSLPDERVLFARACSICKIAKEHKFPGRFKSVMIGGAPFFMSALESVLEMAGFDCYYAFSKRVVEEKDGIKKSVFKHEGFVK